MGTLKLEVPRDRKGTFQTELFERYQRSEKALVSTLMEVVAGGVSTRRVKKITDELCGKRFTRSTVSRLTKNLDEQVKAWAERPLDEKMPFLLADGMHIEADRQGAVRSTTVLLAVGITAEGQREILGLTLALGETKETWKEIFEQLKDRGLKQVELATSDAHEGLEETIRQTFPGCIWQRCQAHFRRNVMDKTPATFKDRMYELLDRMLETSSPTRTREELDEADEELENAGRALETLEEGFEEATAVLALPRKYWRRVRTTNKPRRLIEEIRRGEKVIRIFPNMASAWRLIGALLAEYHDECSTGRTYLNMQEYFE